MFGLVARGRGPSFVVRRSLLGMTPARSTLEGGRRIYANLVKKTKFLMSLRQVLIKPIEHLLIVIEDQDLLKD